MAYYYAVSVHDFFCDFSTPTLLKETLPHLLHIKNPCPPILPDGIMATPFLAYSSISHDFYVPFENSLFSHILLSSILAKSIGVSSQYLSKMLAFFKDVFYAVLDLIFH